MSRYIKEIHLANAQALLEHLRPSHKLWRGVPSMWLYRGQGSEYWPLAPAAFRCKWAYKYIHNPVETDAKGKYPVQEQVEYEVKLFEAFVREADQVGLPVPGAELVLDEDSRPYTYDNVTWPPIEYHQALGLAQHSGLPTRLLDVTSSALIAAYFAANSAEPKTRFAIWAINRKFVEITRTRQAWDGIKHVEVPAANNAFLRAQRASFLLDLTARKKLERTYPAIDQVLKDKAISLGDQWDYLRERYGDIVALIKPPILYKITCESKEKETLLQALNDEGINEIQLKPSYENVARNIKIQVD